MWRKPIITALKKTFEEHQKKGSAGSLRRFSTFLNVSPGALSQVLNGKRLLSRKMASAVLQNLEIPASEKTKLQKQIEDETKSRRSLLREDAYELIRKWYFTPILCLFELENPPRNEAEIATRLGLDPKQVQVAVELLLKHELLNKSSDGVLTHSGVFWQTTDNVEAQVIRESHSNDFKLALRALNTIPVDDRDFTGMTFSGDLNKLPQIKTEIRKFRDRVILLMEQGSTNQVYKLNIQLFPLDGWSIGNENN